MDTYKMFSRFLYASFVKICLKIKLQITFVVFKQFKIMFQPANICLKGREIDSFDGCYLAKKTYPETNVNSFNWNSLY